MLKGIVGMLAHGVYGSMVTNKKDIGTSNARETSLRHDSETRMLDMFMMYIVICMVTGKRYIV